MPFVAKLRSFVARHRKALGTYVVLGLALWPVPLLGLLHVEASAVVAAVSFFVSGLSGLGAFRGGVRGKDAQASRHVHRRHDLRPLAAQEALLLVPLVLLTATLAWRPNCDYARGALLFAAMPPVTVAFAVALAYMLAGLGVRHARAVLVLVGLAVAVGGPLWDLGLHPQFYTYNHVFGGVLGPLYDRELALRPGFFIFRALTLLWALLFFLVGRWGKQRRASSEGRGQGGRNGLLYRLPSAGHAAAIALTALVIGAAYANAARLGFNTPAWRIQEALGGHRRTAHFDLYYDPGALSKEKVAHIVEDQEWQYRRLRERLGTAPQERIASYLYPDEQTKARLTGARRTSVTPVWLARPQVHLLQDAYARSFGHELVHAFSREFGLPVLKASRSVGLLEGLAVAFEPPHGRPSPAEQVSAAALMETGDLDMNGEAGHSLAKGVAARLSPLGFWTGRGAVSYTTMGAFVRFLARRYGTARLRSVYARANFEQVYGRPVRALAEEWEAALRNRRRVALAAGALAKARFSRPSLFEVECPHYVPPYVRAYRRGRRALERGDTTAARAPLREALERQPGFEPARVTLARLLLAEDATRRERAARALRLLHAAPDSAHERSFYAARAFYAARGSAQAMREQPEASRRSYERALERLLPYRHAARARLHLRRALAGRPRLAGALAGMREPLAKARRLRNAAGKPAGKTAAGPLALPPAAAVLHAVLLAKGKRYDRAARELAAAPPVASLATPGAVGALRRQRLAWGARWAYRAGRPARAQERARRAADAYRAFGDRDAAARWEAFAAKMRWAKGRATGDERR